MNVLKLGLFFCFFCTNLVCSSKFKDKVPLLDMSQLAPLSTVPDHDQAEMREATVACLNLESILVKFVVCSDVAKQEFDAIVVEISLYRKRYYLLLRKNGLCVDSPVKDKENIFDLRIWSLLNKVAEKHGFSHGIKPVGDQDFSKYDGLKELFES